MQLWVPFSFRHFSIRLVQDIGKSYEYRYCRIIKLDEYTYARREKLYDYGYFEIEKFYEYMYFILKKFNIEIQVKYNFQISGHYKQADIGVDKLHI